MLKREINFADWTGRPQREIITPSLFNDVPNGLQRVIAANQMSWTGNHVLEGCIYDGTSLSEGWVLVNGKIVRVPPQAVGLSIGASLGVNDDGTAVNDESYEALSKAVARVPLWTRIDTGYIDVRPMTTHDGTNLPMFRRAAMHERRIEGKLAFSEAGDPNVDLIEIGIESGEPEIHVQDAGGNDAYIRPDRVGLNDTTFLEYNKLQLADGDEINAASNVMRFLTASTEQARVTATGNVGIGITDPLSKLHVQGSMRSHDLRVREAGASDAWSGSIGQIAIKKNDGLPYMSFHNDAGDRLGILQMGGTNNQIHVDTNSPFSIWTNSLERMRVLGDGKVGIGTASPSKKLDVSGDGRFLNGDLLLDADSYAAGARIGILNKAGGNSVTMFMGARATASTRSIIIGTGSGSGETGDILRVSADGKVGVGLGADYPDRTLDVNGTGRFTGMLTAAGGLDASAGINGILASTVGPSDGPLYFRSGGINQAIIDIAGKVGLKTFTPSFDLSFGNDGGSKTVGIEKKVASGSGSFLFIAAGGSAGNNTNGGELDLSAGSSTGVGTSTIVFKTATAGSAGSTIRIPTTKVTIFGNGDVNVNGRVTANGTPSANNDLMRLVDVNGRTASRLYTYTMRDAPRHYLPSGAFWEQWLPCPPDFVTTVNPVLRITHGSRDGNALSTVFMAVYRPGALMGANPTGRGTGISLGSFTTGTTTLTASVTITDATMITNWKADGGWVLVLSNSSSWAHDAWIGKITITYTASL